MVFEFFQLSWFYRDYNVMEVNTKERLFSILCIHSTLAQS